MIIDYFIAKRMNSGRQHQAFAKSIQYQPVLQLAQLQKSVLDVKVRSPPLTYRHVLISLICIE
jgi:hypothetical protein